MKIDINIEKEKHVSKEKWTENEAKESKRKTASVTVAPAVTRRCAEAIEHRWSGFGDSPVGATGVHGVHLFALKGFGDSPVGATWVRDSPVHAVGLHITGIGSRLFTLPGFGDSPVIGTGAMGFTCSHEEDSGTHLFATPGSVTHPFTQIEFKDSPVRSNGVWGHTCSRYRG